MAKPTTRATFKDYCLRRLGAPVIAINVDDDQVEDRIDDALTYYADYHYDGTQKIYYKYQVQPVDRINGYITLPDNIIGAVDLFPVGQSLSTNSLFSIRYQIALNDLYDLTSVSMVPYYMVMQHMQFIEQLLVGMQPIQFNRRQNRLYIQMDWERIAPDDFLIVEAYQIVDPDDYPGVWGDRFLQQYATALIKRQWGSNVGTKFKIILPGGQEMMGSKIYADAVEEVMELEKKMLWTWSEPPTFWMG